jgi:hypothetical protein
MKIILSRKGFDSSSGKKPSPIFPDGTMLSLPIGDKSSIISYKEIAGNHWASIGELVEQLAGIPQTYRAHLDPDINFHSLPRMEKWLPIFGQADQSESHLKDMRVGPGDVFLFFGLFRPVEHKGSQWQYVRFSKPKHVIFGWMQIAQRVAVAEWPDNHPWAKYHPHFQKTDKVRSNNVLYVAEEKLKLPRVGFVGTDGAGVFRHFSSKLQLTKPDSQLPSHWLLPEWFDPSGRASILSYHDNPSRWHRDETGTHLISAGRGQEFVLDCNHYPEAIPWLVDLMNCSTKSG